MEKEGLLKREAAINWTYTNRADLIRKKLELSSLTRFSVDENLVNLFIAKQILLAKVTEYGDKVRRIDESSLRFMVEFFNDPLGKRKKLNQYRSFFDNCESKIKGYIEDNYNDANDRHRAYTWGIALTNLAISVDIEKNKFSKDELEVIDQWKEKWTPRINEKPYAAISEVS